MAEKKADKMNWGGGEGERKPMERKLRNLLWVVF